MRVRIGRQFGILPFDEKLDEILENDYKRALMAASLRIRTPLEEFMLEHFPEILKVYADRVGTAALVGGANSRMKKPVLKMTDLFQEKTDNNNMNVPSQSFMFPGSNKLVTIKPDRGE